MRLHIPSFLQYLEHELPVDLAFVHHHYTVYLWAQTPVKTAFLQEVVTRCVVKACCDPLGTLTPPEEQSVLKTPPATHLDALERSLLSVTTYLSKTRVQTRGEGDGGEVRYEYRVNLRTITHLVKTVRIEEDSKLIQQVTEGDYYAPLRLLSEKIFMNTGRRFSLTRLSKASQYLERQGVLTGRDEREVRTFGRRVCQTWQT